MDTIAGVIVLFLAIVIFLNLARGTLGAWFAAKFLNRPSGNPAPSPSVPTLPVGPQVTVDPGKLRPLTTAGVA